MYKLYQISDDLFEIHSAYGDVVSMEGTQLAILTYCIYKLGFDPHELEEGFLCLIGSNMDGITFDQNKKFNGLFNHFKRKKVS